MTKKFPPVLGTTITNCIRGKIRVNNLTGFGAIQAIHVRKLISLVGGEGSLQRLRLPERPSSDRGQERIENVADDAVSKRSTTATSRISSGASSALVNRGVRTITNIRFSATRSTSYPDGIVSPSSTARTRSGGGNRPTLRPEMTFRYPDNLRP